MLQTFILGLKKNTAFGSTAYCRHAANRHMEASRLVFPLISFDFLKKTKESASQALLPRGGDTIRRGGAGAGDICDNECQGNGIETRAR